jgi:GNAT superfamily N-acetyltransferase
MEMIHLYENSSPLIWAEDIAKCDWRAGRYLAELISDNRLRELCGETTEVLLLVDNDRLVSFCTLAEQDEIADTDLKPWLGFVYTFPDYRGKRCIGRLIDHACELAAEQGYDALYVSTDQKGLYENFGFEYTGIEKMSIYGEMSMIYKRSTKKEEA